MIDCLRVKGVRRRLHRHVVPAVCAIATALGGCAMPATNVPSPLATDSAITQPMAAVTMEPPIEVGDVSAVYVTVTNLRHGACDAIAQVPQLVHEAERLGNCHFEDVIVLQAHTVSQSGDQVERLDVDRAIEKAGGADKLLAALGDRSFEVVTPPEPEMSPGARVAAFAIGAPILAPILAAMALTYVFALPISLPVALATGAFSDKRKVKDKEFPVGRAYEPSPPPTFEVVSGPPDPAQERFIQSQNPWKGNLFFPRGSYVALEVTAGAIDDRAAAIEQIDKGESPTLRPTQTLRCPWR